MSNMVIAEFLPAKPNRLWEFSSQMGVRHAICKCAPELTGQKAPDDFDALRIIQERFAERGFTLAGLEGDEFDMTRIKLGLPGRDADAERYRRMLGNMGRLGIPLLCYNFMAGIGWHRSSADYPLRGGALTSRFDLREVPGTLTEYGRVTPEQMWDNYAWFLEQVMPAAEAAGVRMGLHPDDPPVPELRGLARIMSSPQGIRRALALSSSPSHGLTYCQANFTLLGDGDRTLLRAFKDRVVFVHFRDVAGTADSFYETFHDDGPTDMPGMIRLYRELGVRCPVRVDHVPTLAGEANDTPGYAMLGRLFAVGYLKGILDTLDSCEPNTKGKPS
jgi:mannonate dehydratase